MNANEQANYADMIEVPVNTCTITAVPVPKKRGRRKKQVDNERVKATVIDTVNKRQEDLFSNDFNPLLEEEKNSVLEVVKNKSMENLSPQDNGEMQPKEPISETTEVINEQSIAEKESAVTTDIALDLTTTSMRIIY